MKTWMHALGPAAGLLLMACGERAPAGPQGNWAVEFNCRWPFTSCNGLAAGDGVVYMTTASGVARYLADGTYVGQWGTSGTGTNQLKNPCGMSLEDGELYVTDTGNARIQVIRVSDGTFVRRFGSGGAAPGQFSSLTDVAVVDGTVFALDAGNHRVQVFTSEGAFVRMWGRSGSNLEEFSGMRSIAADRQYVYVAEGSKGWSRIQVFTWQGEFVRFWIPRRTDSQSIVEAVDIRTDGQHVYVALSDTRVSQCGWWAGLAIYDREGHILDRLYCGWPHNATANNASIAYPSYGPTALAFDNPVLYLADGSTTRVIPIRLVFRTAGALTPNPIPIPEVLTVAQRNGVAILDVDYLIRDPNDATVSVQAVAFAGDPESAPTLETVVPMRSFVEGTATNVGPGVSTWSRHRLSWDMDADGISSRVADYGQLRVAVMAKDTRELMDFHFLTIPALAGHASFMISRSPATQEELLPLWFWLLGAGDPGIALSSNAVVSAAEPARVFARGTDTTDEGRAYLLAHLNVREASADEYRLAREATIPGHVAMWNPLREPPATGAKVNEFNFVTAPTNGWWVVPLSP